MGPQDYGVLTIYPMTIYPICSVLSIGFGGMISLLAKCSNRCVWTPCEPFIRQVVWHKCEYRFIVQRTSATVTLVGIGKSVNVADCHSIDDFQYEKVLFETKTMSLYVTVTVSSVTAIEVLCSIVHIWLWWRFSSSTWFLPAEFFLWPPWHDTIYHQSRPPHLEMLQVSPSVPALHVVLGGQHFDLSAQHTCCWQRNITQVGPSGCTLPFVDIKSKVPSQLY